VRISAGIEDLEDLRDDLKAGLAAIWSAKASRGGLKPPPTNAPRPAGRWRVLFFRAASRTRSEAWCQEAV